MLNVEQWKLYYLDREAYFMGKVADDTNRIDY